MRDKGEVKSNRAKEERGDGEREGEEAEGMRMRDL